MNGERDRLAHEVDTLRQRLAVVTARATLREDRVFNALLAEFERMAEGHRQSLCTGELNPYAQGKSQGMLAAITLLQAAVSGQAIEPLRTRLNDLEAQLSKFTLEGGDPQ